MYTSQPLCFLLVVVIVVLSGSGCLAVKPPFCDQLVSTTPLLHPVKCPEPPCSTSNHNLAVLPLPLLLSLNTDPHVAVLHSLTKEGRICGEVGVSQVDGSVHLVGGGCDVTEATVHNEVKQQSGKVEGRWLQVEVMVEGQTVTVHALTANTTISVPLTSHDCLPTLLEVRMLRQPPNFGYSAPTTNATPSSNTITTTQGMLVALCTLLAVTRW